MPHCNLTATLLKIIAILELCHFHSPSCPLQLVCAHSLGNVFMTFTTEAQHSPVTAGHQGFPESATDAFFPVTKEQMKASLPWHTPNVWKLLTSWALRGGTKFFYDTSPYMWTASFSSHSVFLKFSYKFFFNPTKTKMKKCFYYP